MELGSRPRARRHRQEAGVEHPLNGYVHHASNAEPQYVIKSVKTDHVAIHKGQALRHVRAKKR
jgi:hypothetical protein